MKPDLFALQFVMSVLAEPVARKQQHAIDYLLEENRILAERVGGPRPVRKFDREFRPSIRTAHLASATPPTSTGSEPSTPSTPTTPRHSAG